jgi:hypothetical protein
MGNTGQFCSKRQQAGKSAALFRSNNELKSTENIYYCAKNVRKMWAG